jgi:pyridoxal phosphate enzyme (YggS family)
MAEVKYTFPIVIEISLIFIEKSGILFFLTPMIADNIKQIYERVEKACHRVGRDPEQVILIGVAKTIPGASIRDAVAAGLTDIGENYVQEMRQKREELRDIAIRWHFIGHLQKNKVKSVIDSVHLIHSVDSLALGKEISKRAGTVNRNIPILVEVNTSGETSKDGVPVHEAGILSKELMTLSNITVQGFMTVGPFLPDPEASRPAFRELKSLQESFEREGMFLPHLSMGMTNDFEVAIEEGATMIRIGTAIFGKRKKPQSFTGADAGNS